MTAAPDTPAALLVELAALGIELQAHGARLRFRPQSAMTDDLLARVEPHQPGLLAVLADTETPAGDAATRGFGSGGGDRAGASRGAETSAERTASMQYEAGLSQERADAAAVADVMTGRHEGGEPC